MTIGPTKKGMENGEWRIANGRIREEVSGNQILGNNSFIAQPSRRYEDEVPAVLAKR